MDRNPIVELVRVSFLELAIGLVRGWSFFSVVSRVTSFFQTSTFLMQASDSIRVRVVVVVVAVVVQSY